MLLLAASPARADEYASSPTRAGYEPTGRLLDFEARRELDVAYGVDPMFTYVFETFAAPQLDDQLVTAGLLMLEVDIAFDKLLGVGWGHAYVSAVGIHGRGISDELGDVHGVSSVVAPEDNRLFEAWYEQPLGPLTLRAGLLAADQEFVLSESASTLVSATFGMTAQVSANIVGPFYPVGAPGVSARLERGTFVARAGIYDGTQANTRGIPDELGPARLAIAELAYGPITAGAWTHDERGEGAYAIADAKVDRHVAAFARAGYSPDAPITHYLDAGLRITPRGEDFVSAGIAFATGVTGAETILELTYEAQLGWITLQPDVQLVMLHRRSVGIAGLRATVVF